MRGQGEATHLLNRNVSNLYSHRVLTPGRFPLPRDVDHVHDNATHYPPTNPCTQTTLHYTLLRVIRSHPLWIDNMRQRVTKSCLVRLQRSLFECNLPFNVMFVAWKLYNSVIIAHREGYCCSVSKVQEYSTPSNNTYAIFLILSKDCVQIIQKKCLKYICMERNKILKIISWILMMQSSHIKRPKKLSLIKNVKHYNLFVDRSNLVDVHLGVTLRPTVTCCSVSR